MTLKVQQVVIFLPLPILFLLAATTEIKRIRNMSRGTADAAVGTKIGYKDQEDPLLTDRGINPRGPVVLVHENCSMRYFLKEMQAF